jgi:peroxiredoxin
MDRRRTHSAIGLALAALFAVPLLRAQYSIADLSSGADEMIGKPAPAWVHRGWVNSPPLEIKQLRGEVVLLRFFSDQPVGAPAVRQLYQAYQSQGLAAVAFYNPEPMPTETDPEYVRGLAATLGFDFPVGNDARWETVNRYWLNRADAEPAGMTFLIDRKGIIRYIQPDGRYEKDSKDRKARQEYEKLEKQIQSLLKEPPPEEQPSTGG